MGGDWKRVSCHGNGIFCSHRCVSCRTISLPSFNGLRCKFAQVALFIKEIENMHRVSIELYKHEWKFGRTRNAVGTRAAGECYHSFFEFSQTFTSYTHELYILSRVIQTRFLTNQRACFLRTVF